MKELPEKNSFSLFLFVIAIIFVNLILRKYKGGSKFSQGDEKINDFMYMDEIKLFSKKKKRRKKSSENLNTINKYIQPGNKNGIWD